MNTNMLLILQSCNTVHELRREFNKPFGFLKIISKYKMNKLIHKIEDKIKQLVDDNWTIEYLYNIQQTLYIYDTSLREYMDAFYLSPQEGSEYNPAIFQPMYFKDISKNTIIYLGIVSDTINFTIFDTNTGNSFTTTSKNEVQKSQRKIAEVCKHVFVDFLLDYLYENKRGDDKND